MPCPNTCGMKAQTPGPDRRVRASIFGLKQATLYNLAGAGAALHPYLGETGQEAVQESA